MKNVLKALVLALLTGGLLAAQSPAANADVQVCISVFFDTGSGDPLYTPWGCNPKPPCDGLEIVDHKDGVYDTLDVHVVVYDGTTCGP